MDKVSEANQPEKVGNGNKPRKSLFQQLRDRGAIYWIVVAGLITVGTVVGHWLGQHDLWIELRYAIYQSLEWMNPHPPYVSATRLVLIGDEEYWKGSPARRVPINRAYLARLVRSLDSADPAVIALDFDLRSPTPDGTIVEHPDYQNETNALIEAMKEVSQRRVIVVPQTIGYDDGYVLESDIVGDLGRDGGNIKRGYIALPSDIRQVPLGLRTKDGGYVPSFAEAIVSGFRPAALQRLSNLDSLPYGTYLRVDDFRPYTFSADQVLQDLQNRRDVKFQLAHQIVIVGGGWHKNAYGRGPQIDGYFTPVGWIAGAFIHANYVEALLGLRTNKPLSEAMTISTEVIATFAVALVFALEIRTRKKIGVLALLCLALVALTYVSWQNLGLFFDFFVPVFLVVGHAGFEQIRKWRSVALAHTS